MKIICPVLFGLEKPLLFELSKLGYDQVDLQAEDGQVTVTVPEDPEQLAYHIARCNIHLRIAERCQVELFAYEALDFDQLFDEALRLPWEKYIPSGAQFSINGYSRKSLLFGVPSIQRLLKKAIVKRLLKVQGLPGEAMLPENPSFCSLDLRFALVSDRLSIRLETSGAGLHKRGYRPVANEAPIKETLAAGLLDIMRWPINGREALVDLFCGSGTLAIEAALMASHTAPGLNRRFAFEDWPFLPQGAVERARAEAAAMVLAVPDGGRVFIFASDIDAESVEIAQVNAQRAGVAEWIEFSVRDALDVKIAALPENCGTERVLLLSNPPYGERMSDAGSVEALEEAIGLSWLNRGELPDGVHWGIITADDYFEQACGYRADKRRKLYNGMIKCYLYQYFRAGKRKRIY